MDMTEKITQAIMDSLTAQAKASPRLRMNLDLRNSADDQSQRMLNALEPGTVTPIHRHNASSETVVILRGRILWMFYDENGNEYHVVERDMNMVPNVGEEIFLDTDDSSIDLDGWTVKSRVCDLGKNCWLLSIKHRLDDETGIWKFKEETPHDQFKEQKDKMHELSKEIREQCAHVQELCNNVTKKK